MYELILSAATTLSPSNRSHFFILSVEVSRKTVSYHTSRIAQFKKYKASIFFDLTFGAHKTFKSISYY